MADLARQAAHMNFRDRLLEKIRASGSFGVAEFMGLAAEYYYANHEPFGAAGDFITAPEISQIFGETVGAWCVAEWEKLGRPDAAHLVELGPGRGTLMADLLRATKHIKGFHDALSIHPVERSEKLRRIQKTLLAPAHPRLSWHDDFRDVPTGPLLLIANEFFDALPVRQYVGEAGGMRERRVEADKNGTLAFAPEAKDKDIFETSEAGEALAGEIAGRIAATGGAALIVDYGYTEGHGNTLQAVKRHRYVPVLEHPGEADLTAHVDFATLAHAAKSQGASVSVSTQSEFLHRMGALVRLETLCRRATEVQRQALASGFRRLTAPDQMGTLFKVMTVTRP